MLRVDSPWVARGFPMDVPNYEPLRSSDILSLLFFLFRSVHFLANARLSLLPSATYLTPRGDQPQASLRRLYIPSVSN
jgi:hypothetical protein